jgi:hypothetical protein
MPTPSRTPKGGRPAKAISRFIVMAVLQAARARTLGLTETSAHSWGLNRAIFYAAAKRGFRGGAGSPGSGPSPEGGSAPAARDDRYTLGDDEAIRDPYAKELLFTIGGETQTEERFRDQIVRRFGSAANFEKAWQEALGLMRQYDPSALGSRRTFYDEVYRPRRDELAAQWTAQFVPAAVVTPSKSTH